MKKEQNSTNLQDQSLRKQAFKVPEAYFEGFQERLNERIATLEKEQVPVRRLSRSSGFRIAIAAALVGLALISIPMLRNMAPGMNGYEENSDFALLEEAGVFHNDYDLALYLGGEDIDMEDEDAYLEQAVTYLAMNDVEMDLIFE